MLQTLLTSLKIRHYEQESFLPGSFFTPLASISKHGWCLSNSCGRLFGPHNWKSIAEQNCVKSNILQVVYTMPNADDRRIFHQSSRWCRFDRNRDIRGGILSCVLYSKNSRKFLDIKWLGCPMKTNELLYEALNKRHGELKSVTDARCLIDVLKREFNLSSTQVIEFLVYKNKSHNESKPLCDIDKS